MREEKNAFFGPTDQKLWMFEVSGEVWAGQACAAANEGEFTTCTKSGRQEKKQVLKNGNSSTCASIDQRSPAGHELTLVLVKLSQIFLIFFLKKK